ncbi:MAG: hypothetical protein ABID54_06485, partial [Pseudomonadota bacterium]
PFGLKHVNFLHYARQGGFPKKSIISLSGDFFKALAGYAKVSISPVFSNDYYANIRYILVI